MSEVEALVRQALDGQATLAASEKLSYREAFLQHAGLDPHTATAEDFARSPRNTRFTPRPHCSHTTMSPSGATCC